MRWFFIFSLFLFAQNSSECPSSSNNVYSDTLESIVDSLDRIQYRIPKTFSMRCQRVVHIKTQEQWDAIERLLKNEIDKGWKNIEIRVRGKNLIYGKKNITIIGLNYPDVNISISGKKAKMDPCGYLFEIKSPLAELQEDFYSFPYDEFNLNDVIIDNKGNEVPIRENVEQVMSIIEKADNVGENVWRFRINLPDLTEVQCLNFYILMTRDWTSARHKVIKVENGWLYYNLYSDDLESNKNPNVDWTQYGVRVRYCLINSPISKGVHIYNGRIYIPKKYKSIRVNKGGQLLTFAHCHFRSIRISNFSLLGCANEIPIGIYSCIFENGAFIDNNSFKNITSMAISCAFNTNVVISNNTIEGTRGQAILGTGTNTTICNNYLKRIGWMLNTRAITGGGERLHICDNIIEDFNYSAISCGSSTSNQQAIELSFIIERNIIRLTKSFTDWFLQNTLADGGGIYIGPQCKQGIIRNNVIYNIKGINGNRGIYLDDGAKNLAIYGNLIMNTDNSFDIDLRYCDTYAAGIPDHNMNNIIVNNIMTGGYRFQDKGSNSNCFGGHNVRLGTSQLQTTEISLHNKSEDLNSIKGIKINKFVRKYLPEQIK